MDYLDVVLRTVMTIATIVLFSYGLFKGYDTLELTIYNIYFITLILYLFKTNLMNE